MGIEKVVKDLGLDLSPSELRGAEEAFRRVGNIEVYGRDRVREKAWGFRLTGKDPEVSDGYASFLKAWYGADRSVFDYIRRSSPWPRRG